MNEPCIFCRIASQENQASCVYENAYVIAFMDLHPANVGHTLVVPREHWETIHDIPQKVLVEVFAVVKRISSVLKKVVHAEGISILQFNGRVAGQSVRHFHVHVIPRSRGDALSRFTRIRQGYGGRFKKAERKDLDEIAEKIKEHL